MKWRSKISGVLYVRTCNNTLCLCCGKEAHGNQKRCGVCYGPLVNKRMGWDVVL